MCVLLITVIDAFFSLLSAFANDLLDFSSFFFKMSKANKQQRSIDSFFKNPAPAKPKVVKEEEPAEPVKPVAPPAPKKPMVIAASPPVEHSSRVATHQTEWINHSERFLLRDRNFDVQYAHLYAERLGSMRKLVSKAAENRWTSLNVPLKRMNDLILDEECILVGILFKQMILKPSIVKQLATEVKRIRSNFLRCAEIFRMDLIFNHHGNVTSMQRIN